MQLDRVEINRALAKAIAYKQCGKQAKANQWAGRLLYLLDCMDVANQDQLNQLAADWSKDPT